MSYLKGTITTKYMQYLKFLLVVALSLGMVFLCNTHQPLEMAFPPLGKLFSPFDGFWQNAVSVEEGERAIQIDGLTDAVEIVFDDRRVPHIFAQNKEDLFFAQGYITAMDRLWQKDISVRATSGHLAAIMGPGLVERDRLQRKKGLLMAAENANEAFSSASLDQEIADAYTAGINAYIADLSPEDYPIEFKLLDYKPEPWTTLKSAIFFKSMAESLCARHMDLATSNALDLWGKETFDFLYPEYNPKQSPIIPADVEWNFATADADTNSTLSEPLSGTFDHEGFALPSPFLGSNNWAVSGKKTTTGLPILCNDPHLQLTLPSIWYEVQLHTPDFNSYGVSLPGTPGVIIGFNENIAWGQTNVGHDVLDWYQIEWVDEKKEEYLLDGKPKAVSLRYDTIWVRGSADPEVEVTKLTEWGPVVYEAEGEAYQDLAMRWIAHDKPTEKEFHEIGTFYYLMKAKNMTDYFAALKGYDSPAQNFVFASNEGDIAIQVNGIFPIKEDQQGRFVQAGNTSKNAWKGFIPRDQVPKVINPERGFVASANQHSTTPDYPYYYLGGFDDYRGRFINQELAAMDQVAVSDMKALQQNNYSLKAKEALPLLLSAVDSVSLSSEETAIVNVLKDWDYRYDAEDKAPTLFDLWFRESYNLTFDELKEPSEDRAILYPEAWRYIALFEDMPTHRFFDQVETEAVETAAVVAKIALAKVAETYAGKLAEEDFDWGHKKGTIVGHLGGIKAFDSDMVYSGGTGDAPNAIKPRHGPSWRMIVVLGQEVEAYGVFPGGQSGNPGSPFYDNTIEDWAEGTYYPLYLMAGPDDPRVTPLLTYNLK